MLSHHWRAIITPTLFHSVVVPLFRTDPTLYAYTGGRPKIPDISAFNLFLSTKLSSNVKKHIKDVTFEGEDENLGDLTTFELDVVLTKLPALEAVTLRWIDLKFCGAMTPLGWKTQRPLTTLRLEMVTMDQPSWVGESLPEKDERRNLAGTQCCIVELLNLFSTVHTIEAADVVVEWQADGPSDHGLYWDHKDLARAAGSQIRSSFRPQILKSQTQTESHDSGDLLELLLVSGGLRTLRDLTLGHGRTVCKRVLKAVGGGLSHLCIVLSQRVEEDASYNAEDNIVRSTHSQLFDFNLTMARLLH